MATDWSITHSPTPRYLSTHFDTSLFSPATLSVLKLGLDRAAVSFRLCRCCGVQLSLSSFSGMGPMMEGVYSRQAG